ncbi:ribosomal protein S18-alanine N-acetyltransferase [Synechococcus sp. WC10meta]|jgi:ribosomal-protein-alanine N-acetyltransferase
MGYRLQVLDIAALPQLLELDRRCYGGHWGEQGYRAELERPTSLVIGAVAEPEGACGSLLSSPGTLVGFGILWRIEEEAHIISLAVDPAHRRRGLGRRILEELLSQARAAGCRWATLEVRASNQAAIRLYESAGFQLLGRRKGYYNGEDGLVYWKKPI